MSDQTDVTETCAADLRRVDLLEDMLRCMALNDAQEMFDIIDGQWLYRCRLVQLKLLML